MNKESSIRRSKPSETSSSSTPRSLPFEARRLLKQVQTFSAKHGLWQTRSRILVAVSGGPDSVCLLDILSFLQKKYRLTLAIAHVNYQLRGKDSVADELFVKTLSETYDIPCFTKRYPKDSAKTSEQALRSFRYDFFESIMKTRSFDTLALGHQMNDQAETFLMRLLRGAGPKGLSAMLPKNDNRIRPLLILKREDILRYLDTRGLGFRTDKSNTDTRYTRNRIRHELLPLLEDRFNPNVIATLAKSAGLFRGEDGSKPRSNKNVL